MRVEAHNRLREPFVAEATRVIIYDDEDRPLAIAIKLSDGAHHICRVGDPEFDKIARMLGADNLLVLCKPTLPR